MTADWARLPHELLERISLAHRQRGARRESRRVRHHVEAARDGRVGVSDALLVVGNGAREDALSWRLARRRRAKRSFAAPGNAGTASRGENWEIAATDGKALATRVCAERIDLAVLGPETAIAAGVGDRLRDAGIAVFGPIAFGRAARIEQDLREAVYGAPRHSDGTRARRAFARRGRTKRSKSGTAPWSLKPTGLLPGKGVVVTPDVEAASAVARRLVSRTPAFPAAVRTFCSRSASKAVR